MATDTAVLQNDVNNQGDAWDGGKPPFKASYGKLMMWYFLVSDAFTFAGFLIAYGTLVEKSGRSSHNGSFRPPLVCRYCPGGVYNPLLHDQEAQLFLGGAPQYFVDDGFGGLADLFWGSGCLVSGEHCVGAAAPGDSAGSICRSFLY